MHDVAFSIGGFQIYWYGILLALGFYIGIRTATERGARSGIAPEAVADLGFWIFVGALVGARALYIATYWREDFAGKPLWEVFALRRSGLVFYGGLIGASVACICFTQIKRLPLWKLADVFAPSIALGHAFGRLGCLMTGCCYGRECHLPWAIYFPATHATEGKFPVHPTQLYESALNFALYGALAWLYRRKKFDGQVFATYLVAYAALRSFVELFRGDYQTHYIAGWITPAHLVSVGIFVSGVALFTLLRAAKPAVPAPHS